MIMMISIQICVRKALVEVLLQVSSVNIAIIRSRVEKIYFVVINARVHHKSINGNSHSI
jgi:hypothetical protein